MSIDIETVKKVAKLARIDVPEADLQKRADSINGILKWIDQLQEVDTEGVEPLANVADIAANLREDAVTDGDYPENVLKNAPEEMQNFYVVPKVIETKDE